MSDLTPRLVLFRGLPGAGKSTLANALCDGCVAADDFFDIFNEGKFDPSLLEQAHAWCLTVTTSLMEGCAVSIGVHNTFTQEWEMEKYFELAKEHDYTVHTVIVENRHGHKSVHDVPEETVKKMKKRFDIVL